MKTNSRNVRIKPNPREATVYMETLVNTMDILVDTMFKVKEARDKMDKKK